MSFFQINTPDLVEKRTLISQRIRSSTAGKKYRIVGQTTRGWVPTMPLPRAPCTLPLLISLLRARCEFAAVQENHQLHMYIRTCDAKHYQ